MSADAILIATVADALGALMAASEMAFEMIKWLGAACPAYVGWKLLRSGNVAATTPADADAAEDAASRRAQVLFSCNFLVAVTNPKALLFISAFLPQFIDTSASLLPQYAILTLAQCLLNLLAMLIYAALGARIGHAFHGNGMRWLNRVSGGTLIALAGGLGYSGPRKTEACAPRIAKSSENRMPA